MSTQTEPAPPQKPVEPVVDERSGEILHDAGTDEQRLQYRELSVTAVVAAVLGVASFMMLIAASTSLDSCLIMSVIRLSGIVVGVQSLLRIHRSPDVLTGMPLAVAGVLLSVGFLVSGVAMGSYIYLTEVPEGYSRISFGLMRPDEIEQSEGVAIPPDVMQHDGEKIFIKGYMRPPAHNRGLDSFLLVRDNNECCFGNIQNVKYYDQIQVYLVPPLLTDYVPNKIYRVAGTIKIDPSGLRETRPVYTLTADYIR